MKTHTGTMKNGKPYKGIYTNSGMPNQKPKRVRSSFRMRTSEERLQEAGLLDGDTNVKFDINLFGVLGAIATIVSAPLPIDWKIGLSILFLASSVHVEVEDDDK